MKLYIPSSFAHTDVSILKPRIQDTREINTTQTMGVSRVRSTKEDTHGLARTGRMSDR